MRGSPELTGCEGNHFISAWVAGRKPGFGTVTATRL